MCVNKGEIVKIGPRGRREIDYSEVNCGLCTIAAVLTTHELKLNSAMVARLLGFDPSNQHEESFARAYLRNHNHATWRTMELSPDEQQNYSLAGMRTFVKAIMTHFGARCYVSQEGSWDTLVKMSRLKEHMLNHSVGTQFAVYGCMGFIKGMGAHWNYAIRTANGVEFRDYQYNTSQQTPEKRSDSFIPPKSEPYATSSEYTQGIVLVFTIEPATDEIHTATAWQGES